MNRLIAKLLSIVNVVLFILLAIVAPLLWLLSPGGMHMQPMQQPVHMIVGVFTASILVGVVVCGFIAFMSTINDSLLELNAKMDELLAHKRSTGA